MTGWREEQIQKCWKTIRSAIKKTTEAHRIKLTRVKERKTQVNMQKRAAMEMGSGVGVLNKLRVTCNKKARTPGQSQ